MYTQSELKEENSQLVEKLEDIVKTNKDLREANLLLQERCDSLLEDLSIKEAQWSEKEEQMIAEVIYMILYVIFPHQYYWSEYCKVMLPSDS